MQDNVANTPPRGTIIVDSSALLQMSRPISPRLLVDNAFYEPKYYLEMLRILARNGFRIVIPEIVSIESGNVLKTGKCLDDYFTHSSIRSPILEDLKTLVPFLKNIAHGDEPSMHIVSSDNPPRVKDYIYDFYNATNLEFKLGRVSKGRNRGENCKIVPRSIISRAQRTTNKEGLGDDAIVHMMEHEYAEDIQHNRVFVLNLDTGLRKRLYNLGFGGANIKPQQLFYSLARNGLLAELHMNPSATLAEIEKDMIRRSDEYIEDLLDRDSYRQYCEKHPLHALLAQAAAEQSTEPPQAHVFAAPEESPHPGRLSQRDKFEARLAKRHPDRDTDAQVGSRQRR